MTQQQVDKASVDIRTLILDATEQIMLEEGYAGVSSRKVAIKAGLKSNLLHYYFRTMDDLFTAAFNRMEDKYDERFARAASSSSPLRDLWTIGREPASAKLILEFTALASHRPAIRQLIGRSARRDRSIMTAALESIFEKYDVDREEFPPKVIAILMAGLTRALSTEKVLGSEDGHAEALEFVDRLLRRFEGPPDRQAKRRRAPKEPPAEPAAEKPEGG
jgi:AcrR family transcriptional regulator